MAKKSTKMYKGKSMRLGGGGRFAKLEDKLQEEGYSKKSAGAIAASRGRSEYGKAKFQKMAATGRKRATKGRKK